MSDADPIQSAYDQGEADGRAAERRLADIEIASLRDEVAGLRVWKDEYLADAKRRREAAEAAVAADPIPF